MNYRGHHIDVLHVPACWIAYVDRREVGISGHEIGAFRVARRFIDMKLVTRPVEHASAEVIPIDRARMMQGIGRSDWEG